MDGDIYEWSTLEGYLVCDSFHQKPADSTTTKAIKRL